MSSARADILAAIAATRAAAHPAMPNAAEITAQAWRLLDMVPGLRPDRVGADVVESFRARVTLPAIGATAEHVQSWAEMPDAVRRYLATHQLPASIALQPHPQLQSLDWQGVVTHPTIAVDEPVAVGLALGGVAETGSLIFHSGHDAPTLFAFLPVHHIVALETSRIWPWLEDYTAALATMPHPRNVNLVTGASGTTDIEGALVRGAHGPGFLHVVLIGERSGALTSDL